MIIFLKDIDTDVNDKLFNYEKSIKYLVYIDIWYIFIYIYIYTYIYICVCVFVINNYKTETDVKYDDREGVASILSSAKNSILDFYLIMKLFVS